MLDRRVGMRHIGTGEHMRPGYQSKGPELMYRLWKIGG